MTSSDNPPAEQPADLPADSPADLMAGLPGPQQQATTRVVLELERHASQAGWDGPVRLFALVRTAGALERDPELSTRLPADVLAAAQADPEHLTAVEQDGLPEAETLGDLLGRIAWPDSVDGAAIVLERSVVPPAVEKDLPEDEDEAARLLADHPDRRDVRMAAAVLRSGATACAVRARDHDTDDKVAVGPDLVPALLKVVSATLE